MRLERATRPSQPAARHRPTRPEAVVLVEPDRALTCGPVLAELVDDPVRALTGLDAVVEAAEPPCRLGEHVLALGLYCRHIRRDPPRRVERLLPVVAGKGLTHVGEWLGLH